MTETVTRPGQAPLPDVVTATIEVIVPVYNEERSLPGCVEVLEQYLRTRLPFAWTITVVDNASTDETLHVAEELADRFQNVRVIHLDRKGRGHALKTAWSWSDADVVAYMDVDLSTGLDGLLPLVAPLVNGHSDLAIGTRLAPGARTIRGPRRELISRGYNQLIRWVHGSKFTDAQCGFKAARTEAIRPLLDRIEDDGWFFDTELLLIAEHNGLRIHEVPVDWVEDTDSRVALVSTAWDDVRGLVRVARAKANGKARLPNLPQRPDPVIAHPNGSTAERREGGLSWQLVSFATIGAISTAMTLVLYAVLRSWFPVLAANLVALIVSTLFNTEANRRLTFLGRSGVSRANPARIHLQGFVVFGLYYAFTSGALLALHAAVAAPSRWLELGVLLAASAIGTVGRFVALRSWVFRRDV